MLLSMASDVEVLRGLIDQLRETSALLDRTRPLRKPTALRRIQFRQPEA